MQLSSHIILILCMTHKKQLKFVEILAQISYAISLCKSPLCIGIGSKKVCNESPTISR